MQSLSPAIAAGQPLLQGLGEIKYLERDGEFWFTGDQLGQLLGYSDPHRNIAKLHSRHVQQLQEHTSVVKLTTEAGTRNTRVFSQVGALYLIMKSDTEKANEVSMVFAQLLKRLYDGKLQEHIASLQGEIELLKVQHREDKEAAVRLALGLHPSRRKHILPAVRYRRMGLKNREIGKLLDEHDRTVGSALSTARKLGLLEPATRRAPVIRMPNPSPKTSRPSGKAA
ncbi:hypothetical protein DGI_2388 [Megalodesulfovibrio gigas DSM 1382 = ATCC 19364]|uniref:Bro-N domain-containing protein n=1 Tax=Megalodesulfovibrio gigas (strain ATCC 19364 / DSM 1382 / NCIMB 9332 / VKM B-1759) TaxID=1121448 RepID=T2GD97_MEGG1|nr:hypothetical protein DGI_2388 [Megalodesulfovibrio gigas DSM 1382 = ATCC 19364]